MSIRSRKLDIRKSPILNTWINIVYASIYINYTSVMLCIYPLINFYYDLSSYLNLTLVLAFMMIILLHITDTLFQYICENRFDKNFVMLTFNINLTLLIFLILLSIISNYRIPSYDIHKLILISIASISLPTVIITSINRFLILNLYNL